MNARIEVYRRLREEKGLTYEEIGDIFGISRQAVHQALTRTKGDNFREKTIRKIKYAGLRNWMLENRVTVRDLERRCGYVRLVSLTGPGNLSKKNIELILAATGLTYEECFKEDEQYD